MSMLVLSQSLDSMDVKYGVLAVIILLLLAFVYIWIKPATHDGACDCIRCTVNFCFLNMNWILYS